MSPNSFIRPLPAMQRIDLYAKMFSDACAMLLNHHTDAHQDPCPLPMNEYDNMSPSPFIHYLPAIQRIDMYAKMFNDASAMLLNPHTDAHQDPCPLPMNEGFDESQPRSSSEGQLTNNAETYTGVSTNQNHKDSDACAETLNKESVYGHDSAESNNPSLKHNTQETGVESGPCVYLWGPQEWLMHPSLYCKYMERYMCMPLEVDSATSLSSRGPSFRDVNDVAPNLLDDIVKQIEYYFSSNNLTHDVNFQEHMKYCGGWVPLPFVASLPEVRELTLNVKVIEEALKTLSFMIEIKDGTKLIRHRHSWLRWNHIQR